MRVVALFTAVVVLPLCIALATRGGDEPSVRASVPPPSDRAHAEQSPEFQAVVPAVPLNPHVPSITPAAPAPGVYPPPGDVIYGAGAYAPTPAYGPAPAELNIPPVKYVSLWPDSLSGADGNPIEKPTAKFGAKLFSHVTSVSFAGPAFPVNSDGSFGGLAAPENGTMTIYEHYIVSEEPTDDDGVLRTVYPYDKLGKFEQVIKP